MKILFSSYAFAPGIGGIENASALLATQFVEAGHEVRLITQTPGAPSTSFPYPVFRRPSFIRQHALLHWCDVFFQNNISLPSLILAVLMRKPALVVHQTWIRNTRGEIDRVNRIKRALLPRVRNVAISNAIARDLGVVATIIGNPYDDDIFQNVESARPRQILFVGRLVSDKGADILLRAAASLRDARTLDITIIGDGPEREALEKLARDLQLNVRFAGAMRGEELVRAFHQHQLLVVPSRWAEPFGIVALEGIACGCVVIGSADGGLPDAIGPCGLTFRNGDEGDLAEKVRASLGDAALRDRLRAAAPAHLARFRRKTVAAEYLRMLEGMAA
ncbi:MAG: glycosyltransferase family 4 protein [Verrucomicrobiota bacterium]|nr:glycosyltransferase family 4 protein [Verrucomicrobiota bacterium]